ncbi:Rhodanese-related sulfurtransferase [Reichenbachiella agariperforans]|uniref:Rhodanese-related sulfurtransferase n=1 Tax=Reichenbachiella agariperforans TaxID=156994 RepID=A0A1M6SJJ0_REIAG|nr:rhodanese-like domain-containing protein [Reichenbachiella agariperforans]SHK44911.1 Rhodanese-related sulfurtransferase [Reichenbachiella agariperforans]
MKSTLLMLVVSVIFCSCSSQKVELVSANDFHQSYQDDEDAVLLDLRTTEEMANGALDGAVQLDFHQPSFNNDLLALDKSKTYYIYCRSGGRSGRTAKLMKENGFQKVYDLDGGISDWITEGLPVVTP